MIRRVVQLVPLLIAGAIVNVAVAWILRADLPILSLLDYVDAAPHSRALWCKLVEQLRDDQKLFESRHRSWGTNVTDMYLPSETSPVTFPDYDNLIVLDAGWPVRSMRGYQINSITIEDDAFWYASIDLRPVCYIWWRDLPSRPLWPGFAINTIFYAAILGLMFFAPGMVKRTLRRSRGLCPACAYPVGTSPFCTECGGVVIHRCSASPS